MLVEERGCSEGPCPVHCIASEWASWSTCTKSCGSGTTGRTRSVVMRAQYGGYICPSLQEEKRCNDHPCAKPCTTAGWGSWTSCSVTCGTGVRKRSREMLVAALHGGECTLEQSESCTPSVANCPVDCVVQDWGSYGQCDNGCGLGRKTRTRPIITHPAYGGKSCPSPLEETLKCVGSRACGWRPCSHVRCHYNAHPTLGSRATLVQHDRSESNGAHHYCAVHASSRTCRCSCFLDPWHRVNDREGVRVLGGPGFLGKQEGAAQLTAMRAKHEQRMAEAKAIAKGTAADASNWPLRPLGVHGLPSKPWHALHSFVPPPEGGLVPSAVVPEQGV